MRETDGPADEQGRPSTPGGRMPSALGAASSRRQFLRVIGAAGAAATGTGALTAASARTRNAPRPNIVLVLVDDLGWPEFGCYGSTFNETPHVDRLAASGMRFTDAYASAPVCSPDRASIMTGQYPARVGITDYLRADGDDFLAPEPETLSGLLSAAGYTTGIAGKWHLTETYNGPYRSRPGNAYAHGFDSVIASEREYIAAGDYFAPYFFLPQVDDAPEGEYLTDRLNREAVNFITEHADQPFFLYLSHYAVHAKLAGKPEKVEKYRNKPGAGEEGKNPVLAAMLESVDEGVGMITETLEKLGLTQDTLVLVMSDNGGDGRVASNAPLRGSKTELYEGGIRVPLIARWPGVVQQSEPRTPVNSVDLLPTFLELTGAGPDQTPVDGVSLAGLLMNGQPPKRQEPLYWVYPHHHDFLGAARQGAHKLIQYVPDGHVELYNLRRDIGETTDLAQQQPQRAAELRRQLAAHIADTGFLPPTPGRSAYPQVDLDSGFDKDGDAYDILTPAPENHAGSVTFDDGAAMVTTKSPSYVLFRSAVAPGGSEDIAVSVRMRSFAGEGISAQDTLFVGLIQDERNYVAIWHNHHRGRTGWDVVQDGKLTGQRLRALDGKLHLNKPGARYALVTHRGAINAFADTGEGWNFVFTADVSELISLDDPRILRNYRYGFGLRTDAGTIAADHLRGARARQ